MNRPITQLDDDVAGKLIDNLMMLNEGNGAVFAAEVADSLGLQPAQVIRINTGRPGDVIP